MVQYGAARCSEVQYGAVWCSKVQYGAVKKVNVNKTVLTVMQQANPSRL